MHNYLLKDVNNEYKSRLKVPNACLFLLIYVDINIYLMNVEYKFVLYIYIFYIIEILVLSAKLHPLIKPPNSRFLRWHHQSSSLNQLTVKKRIGVCSWRYFFFWCHIRIPDIASAHCKLVCELTLYKNRLSIDNWLMMSSKKLSVMFL